MKTLNLLILASAAVIAAGAGPALSQSNPNGSLVLPLEGEAATPASWRNAPSAQDLEREYPPLATLLELGGGAQMRCTAEVDGHLDDCHAISEWPVGLGFGSAAVRTAQYMSMNPGMSGGKAIASPVTIPVKFQMYTGAQKAAGLLPTLPVVSPEALGLARQLLVLEGYTARLRSEWTQFVERQAASVASQGQGTESRAVFDALRAGVVDTTPVIVDRYAHHLAERMSIADLQATIAFMKTPAGTALVQAQIATADESDGADLQAQIIAAARRRFCAQTSCSVPPG